MKIDFVEVAGFRGVRERLRVEFSDGFVVLAGRNGAGKSTVIDAIDFALSGTINRFSVTDAKGGGLEDHIWWMGDGRATAHYVSVGFVDADGARFSVLRDRDGGTRQSVGDILTHLCQGRSASARAIETLIQTSIIRDELIATLSLDLPEQARFAAVRSAMGAIAGPDYSKRTLAVLSAANALKDDQEREIQRIQDELGRMLSALTEARSVAEKSADLADAIRTVQTIPSLQNRAENTEEVRGWVADRRRNLSLVQAARSRSEKVLQQFKDVTSARGTEELAAAETAHGAALKRREEAAEQLGVVERLAAAERETDEYAAHLSAVIEHGAIVGLNHGRCPLCDAERTGEEFEAALAGARNRLAGRAERLHSVVAAVDEAMARLATADEEIATTAARLEELRTVRTVVSEEGAAIRRVFGEIGFNAETDPERVQRLLLTGQEQLAQVERALFILEASSAVDRVKTLEARVLSLKEQSEAAAAKLSHLEKAVESARQIDASSRTVANQVLEEQFDTVMPLLKELYRRLRPHPDWLEIEADFGGRVRASLNFVVGGRGNPQFLFSSGQRRAAGLAFLLAIHLSRPWCRWNSLVLDDPVQHIDDYRALNLAEVLSSIRRTGRQVVVAVEDVALADVLCRRLRSATGDNGRRIDLQMSTTGTTEVASQLDIAPLPSHVLQQAKAS